MKIGMSKNEYGTPVSVHICDTCGVEFTVCPAADDNKKGWENCLIPECDSYDEKRDIDKWFDDKGKLKEGRHLAMTPEIKSDELLKN